MKSTNLKPKLRKNMQAELDLKLKMRTILGSKNTYPMKKPKKTNKRSRKSLHQIQLLEVEFAQNPDWDKEDISRIAQQAHLTEAQVYKWGWDQKQKLNFTLYNKLKHAPSLCQLFASDLPAPEASFQCYQFPDVQCTRFNCTEILFPFVVDQDIMGVQKAYRDTMEWLNL